MVIICWSSMGVHEAVDKKDTFVDMASLKEARLIMGIGGVGHRRERTDVELLARLMDLSS